MTFMLAIFAGVFLTIIVCMNVSSLRNYGVTYRKVKHLSWPAKQILKEYNALPRDNRPYGNMIRMLTALDVNVTKDKANHHFSIEKYSGPRQPNMDPLCYRTHRCGFSEYHNLYHSFGEIQAALSDQRRELEKAGVAGSLDDAKDFIDRLRQERNLINEVTKELT